MKTPFAESMLGWASLGFFVLWILEIRRTEFKDSYWLIMLCLSCLLAFQYLRRRRNAEPMLSKYVPEDKKQTKPKAVIKPSLKKKK
ncbi:MAG: hypothetical protein U0X91_29410 [Spirosomataceae bacterium]